MHYSLYNSSEFLIEYVVSKIDLQYLFNFKKFAQLMIHFQFLLSSRNRIRFGNDSINGILIIITIIQWIMMSIDRWNYRWTISHTSCVTAILKLYMYT